MELVVCKDREELARAVNKWMQMQFAESKDPHAVYVPAGSTPEPLYRLWREERPDYLEQIEFVQIDDVLSGREKGCFKKFLERELEPWRSHVKPFEGGDLQAEIALLGLGLNGHVAFHEPGLAESFYSGCLPLSKETCQRLNLEEGTWGASYGLGAFMACKGIALLVWGESKREILRQFLAGKGEIPALELRHHSNLKVFVDQAAYDEKPRP